MALDSEYLKQAVVDERIYRSSLSATRTACLAETVVSHLYIRHTTKRILTVLGDPTHYIGHGFCLPLHAEGKLRN